MTLKKLMPKMNSNCRVIDISCSDDSLRHYSLHADFESVCRMEDALLHDFLTERSGNSGKMQKHNIFLAEERGVIVGSCRLIRERPIGRAVLRLLTAPGCNGSSFAADLVLSALKKAEKLETKTVHTDLKEDDKDSRRLFSRLGFKPVRRYTEMTLNINNGVDFTAGNGIISCRHLQPGGEAELTKLQNRAFGGSWGFCPNTKSDIVQKLSERGFGHEGIILANTGEKTAGYCWTSVVMRPNGSKDVPVGRIHMLGLAPEFRGRGLSKPVLLSGLNHLARQGIKTIELTSDNENTAAGRLYSDMGFKPKETIVWYEKLLQAKSE